MTKADEKRRREMRDADWRWMLEHAQGRRILAELIARAGLMQPVFSEQPLRTAYAEGRRSLGGEIYARLTEVTQAADRPALLAEVLHPSDVRNSRNDRTRDDPDPDAG